MGYADIFQEIEEAATAKPRLRSPAGLTPEQLKAWQSPLNQSAVISAGAGAGKTRLLVERVNRLLTAGVDPSGIAVLSFTRKAANEILERVRRSNPKAKKLPACSTIHALALKHLTQAGQTIEIASDLQLQEALEDLAPFLLAGADELTPGEMLMLLNRARETPGAGGLWGMLSAVYEEALQKRGLQDFTGLLKIAMELPPKARYTHVLVDEAQDLSELQRQLLDALAPRSVRWYIGDADQSIYSFRGSHASMLEQLRQEAGALYTLTQNHRCARAIVQSSNAVIRHNPHRLAGEWRAARSDGGVVMALEFCNEADEQQAVWNWLQEKPLGRCVLARTQKQLIPFKEAGFLAHTVHEAKGLEWDEVWVMGCQEGKFPHILCEDLAEERRLFYVAMTRARNQLTMSWSITKKASGPCQFVKESGVCVSDD